MGTKIILFLCATAGFVWISRASLKNARSHGFYRFFAWESMLILFLMNVHVWFANPISLKQIVSWSLLVVSLVLVLQGVQSFRKKGKIDTGREDAYLIGFERTTELVTSGVYRYIRHPLYASLFYLNWGIFFKNISWAGILLAVIASGFLILTAKMEEVEDIKYFGEQYRGYMLRTKMFIPYVY